MDKGVVMNRWRGRVLTLLAGLLVGAPALTAAELSLDDCLELALKTRNVIIQTQGAEQLAKAGRRNALGAFLPRVEAGYSMSNSKNVGEEAFETRQLGIDLSMELLNVPNFLDYAATGADVRRANLDVIASEQDLIYAVKRDYYAYLANAQNVSVQEEALKRSEEQLKLIQSRFDLGSAALSDVLKQKVQVGNDRLALLRARNTVVTSRAQLAYTIGVDPRQDWEFSRTSEPRRFEGTLDEAIVFGLEHRPALLAASEDTKAASRRLQAARTAYLPTLSGFLSFSNTEQPFRTDGGLQTFESDNRTYGFNVRWLLFDNFTRERAVTSAKVSRNNANADLADLRNKTVSDIKTAYSEIEQLREQRNVSQENVDAATEDLKITQEKYNLGAATILDLLNAQVSLKEAQVALITVEFNLNKAIAQLENAMGKP